MTRRSRLEAGVRQQHIQQWQRRMRVDRALASEGRQTIDKKLRAKLSAAATQRNRACDNEELESGTRAAAQPQP